MHFYGYVLLEKSYIYIYIYNNNLLSLFVIRYLLYNYYIIINLNLIINIVAFDPQLSGAIATAIREGGMGLNPLVEGNTVMVNIPKPSKESRDLLIKTASKYSERTKQQVREVRKDAMDEIKKLKGSISEDDTRRITKEVDVLTEKKLEKVQKLFKDKETELNTA